MSSTGVFGFQHNQNTGKFQPALSFVSHGQIASSSSKAPISTWSQGTQPVPVNPAEVAPFRRPMNLKRTPEELEQITQTINRVQSRLAQDQSMISHPDVDSPFIDEVDVMNRLLPFHLLQQPKEDLEMVVFGKGKEKARDLGWKEEIRATKIALECVRRCETIRDRWRKLKIRSGQRLAPDDQAYYLAQVVLDADRSENAWLGNELRTFRAEAERMEREKRANSNAARMSHFSAAPQGVMPTLQPQYYRGYPYAYTQAYGNPAGTPTVSTFPASPATPTPTPTSYTPYQANGAIPVQLPVASLPALHALGIIPVPAASLPPEGQPQPAAVLRGSTANGTILSLEINVSLLQSTQMSGLAMVLNTLVHRNNAAGATVNTSSSAPSSTISNDVDSSAL
ncbi:hypothetical protein GALMADRAFT_248572 [Galerina marginata CBS 339.88]|uniref:GLTSCR protein conserved domain-containing protein n=1 Tax=Galerina marginata (strain CBS 339.88) TaxID=685588 RepID=A0A067T7E9_GALM3|nr:hypothetical protein GALMADRAFT_248572 [Galerina marginata CBS 339.88]